ncbi:hypothetical protein CH333_10730 [candidate division WOR-3 bacterium JGI_Cruoil_03_44_89]|uniref:Cation/H+ exchanger transmembrane domain-containing protein n=1 Tax=candidate division WOR-3 bacterium JGI_Cruoil_03_44_89 TaxID=1973748 RepID=A0A235BPH7_UNCW3|nr:MAG: hypothetical protein CH333_10730 [candidate division WOR-3 bacterium JGI_Cruoil_03_44_89]
MILIQIALIIILSKVFSDFASRVRQPPVLGVLILGLLLGPSGFNIVAPNEVINTFSEIGVLILLFMVGLETDIKPKEGKIASVIAINGVLLPFLFGFLVGLLFHRSLPESLILGTILTATSVSVTAMTLVDIGKLNLPEGKIIITAAIVDDVIGIIFLTVILCALGTTTSPTFAILKLIGFFVAAYLVGHLFFLVFGWAERLKAREAILAIAFAMMLIYAFMAMNLGVAAITGAYIAGFMLRRTKYKKNILSGMDTIGHSIFISFFFVDIGLKTNLVTIGGNHLFLIAFILCAILGKLGGTFIGTRLMHLKPKRGLRVGIGMIPRGEVALAIASMALSRGLIRRGDFSSVVVMVIVLALITPILLKWSFRERT